MQGHRIPRGPNDRPEKFNECGGLAAVVDNVDAVHANQSDVVPSEPLSCRGMVEGSVSIRLTDGFVFAALPPIRRLCFDGSLEGVLRVRPDLKFFRREGSSFFELIEQLHKELGITY